MFFFFQGATSQTPTGLFQFMQAGVISSGKINQSKVFNPIQVKSQVPLWINQTEPVFVEFVQSYYDWIVNEYGYTGINVVDLGKMADIEETPDFLLPNHLKMYAPDMMGIYNIGGTYQPTPEQIRNTIHNIKTEIYQRKSSEDSFRAMMVSLFGISAGSINISYPKRKILRLNGGRMDWMSNSDYYGITSEYSDEKYTMIGSHLNQGVFPDNRMWQDFSYILTSEIDDSNPYYEAVVKETLHPAGLLGLYEKVERYAEGGYDPGPVEDYEWPKVRNYYPYNLGSTGTLNRCAGCTGIYFQPGWTFPTFVYPSWDKEIMDGPSANFGSIRIFDFFRLNSIPGLTSPNDYIGDDCNFACGVSGSVDYDWYVGQGDQYTDNVYSENATIEEPELTRDEDLLNNYN